MPKKKSAIPLDRPSVVGTIHTLGGFAQAARAGVDVAEVRIDMLPTPVSPDKLDEVPVPMILTVRRFDEGGAKELPVEVRQELYLEYLPKVHAIDVEVRSLREMAPVITAARKQGATVIASYHDFQATPSLAVLRQWESKARAGGADIFKLAACTESLSDVGRLLSLLEGAMGPLAAMGMGRLGRASRLLLAKGGSVLNYGWLHRPQVSGQWSARDLARLLQQV